MPVLTPQQVGLDGLDLAFDAADPGGDTFLNDGAMLLVVKNESGSDMVVTIDSQTACNYGFDHDIAETVADGVTDYIGPFATLRFNDGDGNVLVAYDDATDVSVAVLKVS